PPLHSYYWLSRAPRSLHPSPTRRSSDLGARHDPRTLPARGELVRGQSGAGQERMWAAKLAGPAATSTSTGSSPGLESATSSSLRSEEHTSELQSRENLVCRLLLEKKN